MPATLKTHTLGCKVNQYETEFVRQGLVSAGYRDAAGDEQADVCIVNTCTVTSEGDSKSRQVIRRLARDNPDSRIVVMGCYATRAPEDIAKLPNVVEVVTDKRELPDLLGRFGVVDVPTGISTFGDRHRAYIKVQDGCMLKCSFCIIPSVRPHLASRNEQDILDEARRLIDHGYREIILTGIHLGHYGVERNRGLPKEKWHRLSRLVESLAQLPGEFRIRLSSIEATEVTRELIRVMAENPRKVCPHLHISMQSGSDDVLRRMRRRWGSQRFVDRCRLLKQSLHKPAITTDIIVGFPGETEREFEETCEVAREVGFSKIHIFPFSARRGTPAFDMPGQLSKQEKADRGKRLAEVESETQSAYFQSLIGERLQVMVERLGEDFRAGGTSCRYAPVEFTSESAPLGQLVDVAVSTVSDGKLLGLPPHSVCPKPEKCG